MGEHKGAITLLIVVLILFGIMVAFTPIFNNIMDTIGINFTKQVDSVFTGVDGSIGEIGGGGEGTE